jgi:hypothetical protein
MYNKKTRIGSPRIIPKVQLSPQVRRKIETNPILSTNNITHPIQKIVKTPYQINRQHLLTNPTINPETHRSIKVNGKTYHRLAKKYNI